MSQTDEPPASSFDVPPASHTVSVSIINSTATIRGVEATSFFTPHIKGYDYLAAPCFSFLIQRHTPTSHRSLLFDLGLRKDWQNLPPSLVSHLSSLNWTLSAQSSIVDIISPTIPLNSIEAIIWSHHHFDHIGDPSVFPSTTAVLVGPGYKQHHLPGYPTNPKSPIPEFAFSGRELIELDYTDHNRWKILNIGPFLAIDYFEDGSFYLLDAPGHTVGHTCALARVTSSLGGASEPDSLILLAGDAFHHLGELRPSPYVPLPKEITPNPFNDRPKYCPCEIFDKILSNGRESPFFKATGSWHADFGLLKETIEKLQVADGTGNVLVLAAHDESLLGVVDFFPARLNGFLKEGWGERLRWRFLRDFGEAVGKEGTGNGEGWGPLKG